MTDTHELNWISRERLRQIGEHTDDELRRVVDEDWTASALIGHLGFWDRFTLGRWKLAVERGEDLPEGVWTIWPDLTDLINGAQLPEWRALPPRTAVNLAIEAAEAIDAYLSQLDQTRIEAARDVGPRLVDRSKHRNQHLDAIEASLAQAETL